MAIALGNCCDLVLPVALLAQCRQPAASAKRNCSSWTCGFQSRSLQAGSEPRHRFLCLVAQTLAGVLLRKRLMRRQIRPAVSCASSQLNSEVFAAQATRYGDADFWDERYQKLDCYDWLGSYTDLKDVIARACADKKGRILNLGCGTSRIAEEMHDDSFQDIVNVDISKCAVEKMRSRNKHRRPSLQWHVADATELKGFGTACFDCVLDKGTLDAVLCSKKFTSIVKMLAEISRVLRPGGVYLIVTLNGHLAAHPESILMPHFSVDIQKFAVGEKYAALLCKKTKHADETREARLPEMLEWASKVDAVAAAEREQPQAHTQFVD